METEALRGSNRVYRSLGIKGPRDRGLGAPRVVKLLSCLLEQAVCINEKRVETEEIKETMTVFHGVRAPSLSISQYVERIFKYTCCSASCFVVAHIYVNQFLQRSGVLLTSLNVHRLLITSIMLAAKFLDDAFFNNAYYAKVGGVSTAELNKLEMKMLFTLDFRLQVHLIAFQEHCLHMDKEGSDGFQIERPLQACRVNESWMNKDESNNCTSRIAR